MNRHPSDEDLLEFCDSTDATVGEQVRRHLESGCDRCTGRIGSMREILAALRVPPLAVAPEAFVRTALERIAEERRLQPRRTPVGALKEGVRRVLEEIRLGVVLDTAAGAAMQGIRGSATSDLRQLLFESPQGNLHLRIEGGSGSHSLIGQLVPLGTPDRLGRGVVRVEWETGSLRGRLSEAGEFHVEGVPAGTIRVRIEWDDRALVTDRIDLDAGLNG
jgi:hypothetical protein